MKGIMNWILLLVIVLTLWGCGFRFKGYESFDYLKGGPGKDFPRKVLWLGIDNQGPYEPEQISVFQGEILKRLRSHKEIVTVEDTEIQRVPVSFDEKNVRYRIPQEIKEKGRREGISSAVQVSLVAPTVEVRRAGLWPFRKTKMFVSVSARILSLDLISETVLLNKVEKEEIAFYYDPIAEEDPTLYQEALEKAYKALTKRVSNSIAEALRDTPWVTIVSVVRGEEVEIPVGKRHGIKSGNEFAAYERTEDIKAFDGRTYPVWGKRLGILRVKEVMEDRSLLSIVSGGGIKEGQILRLLR